MFIIGATPHWLATGDENGEFNLLYTALDYTSRTCANSTTATSIAWKTEGS